MLKSLSMVLLFTFLFLGCEDDVSSGSGTFRIEVFDSPPPDSVESIFLTITEVSVHRAGGEWDTLSQPEVTLDFLELINGVTASLVDEPLESGDYTQLRLVVADSNTVVIDGVSYPLKVPSGAETGVKLNLNFTVEDDEIIEIMVDFDASKSITWTPGNYKLQPVFKVFKKVLSGTVAGSVKDISGTGIVNAVVTATGSNDDVSTVTDDTGAYKLILLEGSYSIGASADGFTGADITYTGVQVQAESNLTGFDFILN